LVVAPGDWDFYYSIFLQTCKIEKLGIETPVRQTQPREEFSGDLAPKPFESARGV
jgi:hypothetical protein